jgi:hypothetical protein
MLRQTLITLSLLLTLAHPRANAQASPKETSKGQSGPQTPAPAGAGGTPNNTTTVNAHHIAEIEEHLLPLSAEAIPALNTTTGEVLSNTKARLLIDQTLGRCSGAVTYNNKECIGSADFAHGIKTVNTPPWRRIEPTPDAKDFYCLINIVRWDNEKLQADAAKQHPADTDIGTIASSRWYVYNGDKTWELDDFKKNNRVFGVKRLWLLVIHLNQPGQVYTAYYTVDETRKLPAPATDLIGLASFTYGPSGGGKLETGWAGGYVDTYKTSDLTVTGYAEVTDGDKNTVQRVADPQKFDNEGKYHIDFSIGVPIKQISELQLDNVNNTVTAKKVDKTNVLGLLDIFPQPVDVKNAGLYRLPHLVLGVKLDQQPLHKILLGGGFGPPSRISTQVSSL